jgi:hypothetical protein
MLQVRGAGVLATLLLGGVFLPAPAAAIVLKELQTKATFENAGVRVVYADDPDSDATIDVEYRSRGEMGWRRGHPLIRIAGSRFVTSLFHLAEGTTYEVRLAAHDAAGVTSELPQSFEITTRTSILPAARRHLFVDAAVTTSGDGSRGSAYGSIAEAARLARAGDVVHIMPGIYHESISPASSGTADAWIVFRGEGDGVILDGGVTLPTETGWVETGDGVYQLPFSGDFNYATLDTVRLFQHANLDSLRADGAGITGGYTIQGGVLYVKAPDGRPLTERVLRVAAQDYGVALNLGAYIALQNLEIRHFDGANISLRNSHHISVQHCRVHHSRQMILVRGRQATDNLIEDTTIWGTAVDGWPWEICHHDHDCSSNAINLRDAGEGNVIRRNRIRGVFNGIYLGQWTTDYPEENALENDVYDNVLEDIVDDGLEPECQAINLRMYGNRFRRVFSPISLAPIETGPTWVMHNVIDGLWQDSPGWERWGGSPGWVKISLTPAGELPMGALRIYHNTALIRAEDHNGWGSPGSGDTHFKNNTISTTRYIYEDWGDWPHPPGSEWDYNNFYTTGSQYVKWDDIRLDVAGFQAMGFQLHGLAAPPRFTDPDAGDFSLLEQDPGIDRGVLLPGINDSHCGPAPDMGAIEYCPDGHTSVEEASGAALPVELNLAPIYPNPFNSVTVVPYELASTLVR